MMITLGVHAAMSAAVAAFIAFGPQDADSYSASDVARLVFVSPQMLPLGAALLGAIVGGLDHRHHLYELSLLITPRRHVLLVSKVALVIMWVGTAAVVSLFVAVMLIVVFGLPLSGFGPGIVIGQVARICAWGTAGVLLGLLFRSQVVAGSVAGVGAFLLEPVVRAGMIAVPAGWWSYIPSFLMFAGFDGMVPTGNGEVYDTSRALSVGGAVAVSVVYLALLGLGAWRSMYGTRGKRGRALLA
jgi:hypothetical protein